MSFCAKTEVHILYHQFEVSLYRSKHTEIFEKKIQAHESIKSPCKNVVVH